MAHRRLGLAKMHSSRTFIGNKVTERSRSAPRMSMPSFNTLLIKKSIIVVRHIRMSSVDCARSTGSRLMNDTFGIERRIELAPRRLHNLFRGLNRHPYAEGVQLQSP